MPPVSLFQLFWMFFYIGLFTVGGGLVGLTLIQQTIVARGLITQAQFTSMVAISESTPGAIGINMATYIGFKFYGPFGGIVTTLGQVTPSIICILLIASLFTKFQEKPLVKAAFTTLRPATAGIILVATAQVFNLALLNIPADLSSLTVPAVWLNIFQWRSIPFYLLAVLLLFKTKIHPVLVVALGAVFGVLFL
ncbi:MAG: chromate transporter [Treponema sp.]|nr:chromate transporter [Treponema sp.]